MYLNSSIDLTVFVSKVIFDANDQQLATECYEQLYAAGATIHLSPWYCTLAALPPRPHCGKGHAHTLTAHVCVRAPVRADTYSHAKFWIVDRGTDREHVGMSTGNWSPTDYPPDSVFPPFGQAGWVNVSGLRCSAAPQPPHALITAACCEQSNRDYTMRMWGSEVVAQFGKVFDEDLERGSLFKPASSTATL